MKKALFYVGVSREQIYNLKSLLRKPRRNRGIADISLIKTWVKIHNDKYTRVIINSFYQKELMTKSYLQRCTT